MAFRDNKFYVGAKSVLKNLYKGITVIQSKTQFPFFCHLVGYPFKITRVQDYCSSYTATLSYRIIIASGYQLLGLPLLAIDAVDQKFKTTNDFYSIGAATPGVLVKKAAATAIVFGTNFTVNTAQAAPLVWGAVLVMLGADGTTVTTKVVSADQVYANEAAAIAALPAADAGKIAIGYITIQNKANAKWTANTDGLDAGAEANAVNFYDVDIVGDVMEGTASPVALTTQNQTLSGSDAVDLRGTGSSYIVGIYTTDGAAVATDLHIGVEWRPTGLAGEVS